MPGIDQKDKLTVESEIIGLAVNVQLSPGGGAGFCQVISKWVLPEPAGVTDTVVPDEKGLSVDLQPAGQEQTDRIGEVAKAIQGDPSGGKALGIEQILPTVDDPDARDGGAI